MIMSLRRPSLAVSASSSDSGCATSRVRRYALSTSSREIAWPSTVAHVSAETDVAGAEAEEVPLLQAPDAVAARAASSRANGLQAVERCQLSISGSVQPDRPGNKVESARTQCSA